MKANSMAEVKILTVLVLGCGFVVAAPALAEDASEKQSAIEDDEIETEDGVETEDAAVAPAEEGSVDDDQAEPKPAKKAKKKKKKSDASLLLPVSQKGAIVLVDGEEVGTTPLAPVTGLTIGTHTVEVTKEGFYTASMEVDLPKDGLIRMDVMLDGTSNSGAKMPAFMKTWWFWTAVGAVVVTCAAVGIYYGVKEEPPDAVPLPPY